MGLKMSRMPYLQWPVFDGQRSEKAVSRSRLKKLIAVAAESGAFQELFPLFADAREKAKRFLYICFLNEAGIERHADCRAAGAMPDRTKGFSKRFYDMNCLIDTVKSLQPDFLATACPAYPFDLVDKVQAALECTGTSFLAVFVPCPTGCMYAPAMSLQSGKLAVETGLFPLYRIEQGMIRQTVTIQPLRPLADYLKIQPALAGTTADDMHLVQEAVSEIAHYLEQPQQELR